MFVKVSMCSYISIVTHYLEVLFREGMVNVHGLLTCTKCSKSSHSHLMNRDLNGSRNILYLMKEWIQHRKRPTIFCRKPKFISQDE